MNEKRQPIIRVVDLTAAYQGSVVLEHVNFEVYAGEVFIIVGGSGSGKSTLLKHMIGLYKPAAGQVFIDGQDMAAATGRTRHAILRKFGVTYQGGALFGSMTVLDNVCLPLEEFTDLPPEAIRLISLMKLKQVALEAFGGHMPSELSGGMQKRAGIARAMGTEGVTIDRLSDVGPALRDACKAQAEGKTTILEMMCTRELGDPFRRDALKKPHRLLDKYKAYG